jgi:DNA polymerase-3 subunit gamma/tau
MKWAANKKMHFEIAAIRAIQTLGQATLTEVLDTLSAIRGGGAMPERPVKKVEAPRVVVPAGVEKKTEPKPVVAPVSVPAPTPVAVPEPAPAPAPEAAAAPVPEPAPAPTEAPAGRQSLSAFVAASLGEKKAPAPVAKPAAKASEEPAPKAAAKPAPAAPIISAAMEELWPQLVARIRKDRPLISNWVESGQLVDISKGVATLAFPRSAEADLARETCERPNNRTFLEKLIAELTGAPVSLKTEMREGLVVQKIAREEAKPEVKVDPMEEFKNDPLIRKALAEFKAEIIPA